MPITGCKLHKRWIECWRSHRWPFEYSYHTTARGRISRWNKVSLKWKMLSFHTLHQIKFITNNFFRCSLFIRCCCFFKRKKKKSSRQKWLEAVQCSPEREAVTLLRATSHSNSRDSVLNPSQDYVQAQSQHTLRYHPSANALTITTPTNAPALPL